MPEPDTSGTGAATPTGATEPTEPPEVPPAALLTLSDGLPDVVDTEAALAAVCQALARGTGPVAIDAERASGYRYSNRAYLIQLRREGSGTALVDPTAFESLAPLQAVLEGTEWILHAATQDLPCLTEVGLVPTSLFDTELAGRLLGYPRVGLATLVETLLGWRMKKEHSAVDWSKRPLPKPWLEYAALDVEVLAELRDLLAAELVEAGKDEWAHQEFDYLRGFEQPTRVEAWRRTSGLHRVRGRRGLGAVRALWETRDEIARTRDVTPGRIIPDAAIVAAAREMPTDREALLETNGFHGRGAERYVGRWMAALREAAEMDEADLPTRSPRGDGPPVPRAWAEKDPVAARRLELARTAMISLAATHHLPVENLLTPDYLRRTLWSPPSTRVPGDLLDDVVAQLSALGARGWQIGLTAPVIVSAILDADADADAAGKALAQPDAGAAAAADAAAPDDAEEATTVDSDGDDPA
jgi:ribonuclease D